MADYTTGELAKLAGVSVRTVQFYDSKDLLKPSAMTEGGRRIYSESDLTTLKAIVFLKELGFALNDISAILHEDDPRSMLSMLLSEHEKALQSQISEEKARLDNIHELKHHLKHLDTVDAGSLEAIAHIMEDRKKLRWMRIKMVAVGLIMDVLWIGTLVFGILNGIWWPFAIGLALAIVLGVLISAYYVKHVAYICPEDRTVFRPSVKKMLFSAHTPSMRKLTCPTCGYTGYCLEVYAPSSKPVKKDKCLIWPSA